jgi:hypothetical protein
MTMSWRFRKSFKVIPGVRLNLTRHGLSATLGTAPFSVNVGPRGVYGNVSIRGTGLWNRTRLDTPESAVPSSLPYTLPASVTPPPVHEIRSASTEQLNSAGLEDWRKALLDAYEERANLGREIATAEYEAKDIARRFHGWQNGFLLRRLFKQSFEKRRLSHETAQAKCEELKEQLRLTTIATEMTLGPEQEELYFRMRDDFAAATESHRIWDALDRRAVNRVAERSAANEAITREPVNFSLDSCDLIQWEQKVPHLPNRTGGDIYIYPGFLLYRASKQAFALIDSREVTLTHRDTRFIEEEKVPADTRTVGHAWAKSNKDGSPDRRFRDNYQIPIVIYASLTFTSPNGLEEEFQLSNRDLAERFAKAWDKFHSSFTPLGSGQPITALKPTLPSVPTSPEDVVAAFANESELARKLATEQPEFWEVLLVEELLKRKLVQVLGDYGGFDASLRMAPKQRFNGPDYIQWLGGKTHEPGPLINRLAECVNVELSAALGQRGEEANAVLLLNAINDIIESIRDVVRWELEVCSAVPPNQLKPLSLAFRGFAHTVIGDIERLRDEFAKIADGARKGVKKFDFHLEFSTPPQVNTFIAEMDKLKQHPEWLAP